MSTRKFVPPVIVVVPMAMLGVAQVGTPPTNERNCPFIPAVVVARGDVPFPRMTVFATKEQFPVPPTATTEHAPRAIEGIKGIKNPREDIAIKIFFMFMRLQMLYVRLRICHRREYIRLGTLSYFLKAHTI